MFHTLPLKKVCIYYSQGEFGRARPSVINIWNAIFHSENNYFSSLDPPQVSKTNVAAFYNKWQITLCSFNGITMNINQCWTPDYKSWCSYVCTKCIIPLLSGIPCMAFFIEINHKDPGKQLDFKLIYSTVSVLSSRKLPWDLIKKCENCIVICLLFLAGKQYFIMILNLYSRYILSLPSSLVCLYTCIYIYL